MARCRVSPQLLHIQEIDVNCRLRHGLDAHTLAHIFQYLDSDDLYTVGGMNNVYKHLINDLVIPMHTVNFDNLYKRGITIPQMFERYGRKIRKIQFKNDLYEYDATERLVQSINKYCSADQLRMVRLGAHFTPSVVNNLPIQFRKVEKLKFKGNGQQFWVQLSESLRVLSLYNVDLAPNFDWTQLRNLTELYLISVEGINVKNFIGFLRQRPKLQVFHYDSKTFGNSTQVVCEALAQFCGEKIRDFCGPLRPIPEDIIAPARNVYDFMSQLTNIKTLCLATHQFCGSDLVDPMKRLARNNTIEKLHIVYTEIDMRINPDVNCFFQKKPHHKGLDMKQFSHLKRVNITGPFSEIPQFYHGQVCDPFRILSKYSSQILANVENLTIASTIEDMDFIQFAPKLRQLNFFCSMQTPEKAAKILSHLESILAKRKNNSNNQQTGADVIEIHFSCRHVMQLFAEIDGRSDSIELYFGPIDF